MDDDDGSVATNIESMVANVPTPCLRPHRMFIAWNGVLTLVFRGFSRGLIELKTQITDEFELADEYTGSKWPKITVGVLRNDNAQLTRHQLITLVRVCNEYTPILAACPWRFRPKAASIVLYRRRSLTQIICRNDYAFNDDAADDDNGIDQGSMEKVDDLIMEMPTNDDDDDTDAYLAKVNAHGHRFSHYMSDVSLGNTLVCFMDQQHADFIHAFQAAVDRALPHYYAWMPLESLHMTLRSLH